MQSFMGVMQMIVMPMFFISGALFPVQHLPRWLTVLNRLDPLTYAVDPMRRLVFSHLSISPAAAPARSTRASRGGAGRCPRCSRSAVVLALGLVMLAIAIWEFSYDRSEGAAR